MSYSKDKLIEDIEDVAFLPLFRDIERAMKESIGLDMEMLKKKSNTQSVVYPRMIFSYLCRQEGVGYRIIGNKINKKHSSVVIYVGNFNAYYKSDIVFKLLADAVMNKYKEIKNGK